MIFHTFHCAKKGYDRVIMKIVDIDVAVLEVAAFHSRNYVKGTLDRFRSK